LRTLQAASAFGDGDHFSVGIQCLTPIDPDSDEMLLAYMDVPANPYVSMLVSRQHGPCQHFTWSSILQCEDLPAPPRRIHSDKKERYIYSSSTIHFQVLHAYHSHHPFTLLHHANCIVLLLRLQF
jgi:hypothetical protein